MIYSELYVRLWHRSKLNSMLLADSTLAREHERKGVPGCRRP